MTLSSPQKTPRNTRKDPDQVWLDELRYWPYTIHQIDDTLDTVLIEGRAKQLLFQALNSKSVTAFVGTGVSAAYGRMGWNEWKVEQLRQVGDLADAFLEVAKHAEAYLSLILEDYRNRVGMPATPGGTPPEQDPAGFDIRLGQRWLSHRLQVLRRAVWDVRNLNTTFNAGKSGKGSFPGGEDIPVLFEIAKKLHDLLIQHRDIFEGQDDALELPELDSTATPEQKRHFHDCTVFTSRHGKRVKGIVGAGLKEVEPKYLFGVRVCKNDGAPIHSLYGLARWVHGNHTPQKGDLFEELVKALFAYNSLLAEPSATLTFDHLAKSLLIDECPHAMHLLEQGLTYVSEAGREPPSGTTHTERAAAVAAFLRPLRPDTTNNLKRDIDGIRQRPDRYLVLEHYRIDRVAELIDTCKAQTPAAWHRIFDRILAQWETYLSEDKRAALSAPRQYISPTSRFILPMLLRLLPDPMTALAGKTLPPPDPDTFRSRRSIIAQRFDPLEKISEDLGIRRFLTTNYDFEIERYYQDKGYNRFDPHKAFPNGKRAAKDPLQFRTNGMGGLMRDMTFQGSTATDLLAFAASRTDADVSIFHLHGRATETDSIVATEREYMDLYLRRDPDREVVDESILMAFAATPILFLGLGMTEADVLRPLRQFMSDQDRSVGYRGIVLLPADKDFDSRAKMSAGLYLRYGAHTIFFGSGHIRPLPDPAAANVDAADDLPLDWLHRVMTMMATLKEQAENRLTGNAPQDTRLPLISPGKLADAIGTLGADLLTAQEAAEVANTPALLRLLRIDQQTLEQAQEHYDDIAGILTAQHAARPVTGSPEHRALEAALDRARGALSHIVEAWQIANCHYTTHRHQNTEDPASERAVTVDGGKYTSFYVDRLTELMHLALTSTNSQDLPEQQRSLNAMMLALDGLMGAIQTASLNASLDSLQQEWQSWWKDWQSSPPLREARFEQLSAPTNSASWLLIPRREVRHKVEGVITDLRGLENRTAPEILTVNHKDQTVYPALKDLPQGQQSDQTGVRIFDRFIYDLHRMTGARTKAGERLITTVAAERGFGKGVFFSTLSTQLGLSSYIRAAHPKAGSTQTQRPVFTSAVFVNFSFATELASAFDMLVDSVLRSVAQLRVLRQTPASVLTALGVTQEAFLQRLFDLDGDRFADTTAPFDTMNEDIAEEIGRLADEELKGLSRFRKFAKLMHLYKIAAEDVRKHAAIGRGLKPRLLICLNAVELLFDGRKQPKSREIADYLNFFCARENNDLPFDLLSVGALDRMGHFYALDSKVQRLTFIWEELANDLKANLRHRAESYDLTVLELPLPGPFPIGEATHFVHLARRTDPRRFLVDNFPVLAMALVKARAHRLHQGPPPAPQDALNQGVKDAFDSMWKSRNENWYATQPPDANHLYLRTRAAFNEAVAQSFVASLDSAEKALFTGLSGGMALFREELFDAFRPDQHSQDFLDWQDLTQVLEGNRFCLTILLAAAEQLVLTEHDFTEGGAVANTLLETVVSGLRNASIGRREEYVLNTVMAVNQRISQIGHPDYDNELQLLLLRNISTLGCPVSPNILVRLPDVREYFNKVSFASHLSRRRIVARALSSLSEQGLLFRISPHPKLLRLEQRGKFYDAQATNGRGEPKPDDLKRSQASLTEWPAQNEYRYAQHRQIQSYCFQRLGHLTAPPITANNFSPTLYAAMPSRVVRLSTEGYLFLRRLLLGLSQYPDIRHEDAARAMPIFNDDDVITRVQALRAALSLARTCFSIAAVSRFDKETTGLDFIRKRGHFETYRVRLRWILRKAWEVHEPRNQVNRATIDMFRVNALYSDEIVWLYNEVAVTCLVQGNLIEAIGHGRQAIYLNRSVEGPDDGGRIHNMLSLNVAIIQLERGRLQSAEKRLNAIVASEGRVKHRLANLAKGYLALIVQMQGRRSEAEERLLNVVAKLELENEDRALAIMLHHLARLVGTYDIERAQDYMRRAIDYAEKGGHEDIRHRILVGEVWMSQISMQDPQDRMESDRVKLREAQRYSDTMGLQSLLVESLHAQGLILLKAGDYSRSGKLMTKAMAIARRNDMTLRLNTTMTNYARVLLARRRVASAKRLLQAAMAMAKRSGYSLEVVRIHKVIDEAERLTTASDTPTQNPD